MNVFLKEHKNFEVMKISFQKYGIIFQALFAKIFPNYYLRNNKHRIQIHVFSELVFRDYIKKSNLKKIKQEIKEEKRNDTIKGEREEVVTEDKQFVLKIKKPSLKRKFSLKMKGKMEQHQLNKCIKRKNKKKRIDRKTKGKH